jgi:hypothetical protein
MVNKRAGKGTQASFAANNLRSGVLFLGERSPKKERLIAG